MPRQRPPSRSGADRPRGADAPGAPLLFRHRRLSPSLPGPPRDRFSPRLVPPAPAGFTIDSPMVSARMAAVLAVALLLLLCGNVQSAQDVTATVTQVKSIKEFSLSSTKPENDSSPMAPAITTPTEGSGATRTAVLAVQTQQQDDPLVLVDLARADEENLSNVTTAPAPSPSEEAVPSGFDFKEEEAEAPDSKEEEPSEPVAPGPDSAYPESSADAGEALSAYGDDRVPPEANEDGGVLDEDIPLMTLHEDNSVGQGYGVTNVESEPGQEVESVAAYGKEGPESTEVEYNPRFSELPADDGEALSAYGDDRVPPEANEDGGVLDEDIPLMTLHEDNSVGQGYGVTNVESEPGQEVESVAAYGKEGPESTEAEYNPRSSELPADDGEALSAYGDDRVPPEANEDGGVLDEDIPLMTLHEDNSVGQGYGVTNVESEPGQEVESVAAYGKEGPESTEVEYNPRSSELPADDGEALSAYGDDRVPPEANEDGGVLDEDIPLMTLHEDNSVGQGYGVTNVESEPGQEVESVAAYGKEGPESTEAEYNPRSSELPADDGEALSAYGDDRVPPEANEDGGVLDEDIPLMTLHEDNSVGQEYGVRNPYGEEDKASAKPQDEGEVESDTSEPTEYKLRKAGTDRPAPASGVAWKEGKCTFYGGMDAIGTMAGACGYGNLYASGYGVYTTALSSYLFKNGMACGACYEVACSGKGKSCKAGSILVTATNFCPPNPGQGADNGGWCNGNNPHFDLSYPAFAKIADPKAGVVPLRYRRVPCKKQGGIRFTLNGNCNFNLVTITNVGGSGVVTEAYMKGDKMDWAPMSRNWGANWQCSRNYCGKGISIKIVTSDEKVSVSRLAGSDWAFGKTYIGQQVK